MPNKFAREIYRNGYLEARKHIAAGIRMGSKQWLEMGQRMKSHDRALWAVSCKWEKQND